MKLKTLLLAAAVALPAAAAPTTYSIDATHSQVAFSVRHMVVANVRGELGKVNGSVTFDKDEPTRSSVEATIDVKGLTTREEKRDGHLKSPDFFDAEKFPEIKFKSTKVEKGEGGKLKLTGDLTLRGVTKPVTLEVEGPTPEVAAFGMFKVGFSATGRINRKEYGLAWNKTLDSGGAIVGDEVTLLLDVELNRPDPAAPKK